MTTLAEMVDAAKSGKKVVIQQQKTKKVVFSGRRYDVIGHRLNGETIEHKNVTSAKAKELRAELIRSGCHRIDKIETRSRILDGNNERTDLRFSEKNYVPLLEGSVPATVSATEKKIADDRNKMATKNFFKMCHQNNLIKSPNIAKVLIYDKENGKKDRTNKGRFISLPKLIFSGTEGEAVFFILNNKLSFEDIVIYLPTKTYNKVVR